MSLNYPVITENVVSKRVVVTLKGLVINWFQISHVHANLMISSIYVWLAKDYKLPGLSFCKSCAENSSVHWCW